MRSVLKSLRRRVRSVLGRPARPGALQQLLALVRSEATGNPAYLELCIELGLGQRARAALQDHPGLAPTVSTRIRLAMLEGDTAQALAQARVLLTAHGDDTPARAELAAIVDTLAPVCAQTCLEMIRRYDLVHAAEPALLAQTGQHAAALARAAELGRVLGPDRWLLEANLSGDRGLALAGLNRYLGEHGLGAVDLIAPDRPLSVNNLRAATTAPIPARRAATTSVVMTAHQCADHLDSAVQSVLRQTHADLELIVVDDASRDDTWARLRALAAADARIRPVRVDRNIGTYAAKNLGLEMATGEFVAFQDADDWSHPERFERCVAALAQDRRRIAVSAHYVRLDGDGFFRSSKVWPLTRWTPNSLLFRRSAVIERIGCFHENRFGSDSEYVSRLRAAFGPDACLKLPQPLVLAAHRPQSLMTAQDTGVDAQGVSSVRSRFQEDWTEELLQRLLAHASLHRAAQIGTARHQQAQLQRA